MMNKNKWKEVWGKREVDVNYFTIECSLKANGYDTAQSTLSLDRLQRVHDFINTKITLQKNDSLFEVGCGSGSFLYPWYLKGVEVGGIDYSEPLINGAKVLMSTGNWQISEATDFDSSIQSDYVLSYGVFLYFPNHEYAERVLKKMVLKAKKAVCIFDIPDLDLKEATESMRRELNGENYNIIYQDLDHLYFHKSWWINLANQLGKNIEIFQIPHSYESMKYRYSVIIG